MAGHSDNPLNHVVDHPTIELPWWSRRRLRAASIDLPEIGGFQITRFMVMELIAGVPDAR